MQVGIDQTLSLERGSRAHDDAPDADEGAIWILQRNTRQEVFKPVVVKRRSGRASGQEPCRTVRHEVLCHFS